MDSFFFKDYPVMIHYFTLKTNFKRTDLEYLHHVAEFFINDIFQNEFEI